jgi:hypothetical protein
MDEATKGMRQSAAGARARATYDYSHTFATESTRGTGDGSWALFLDPLEPLPSPHLTAGAVAHWHAAGAGSQGRRDGGANHHHHHHHHHQRAFTSAPVFSAAQLQVQELEAKRAQAEAVAAEKAALALLPDHARKMSKREKGKLEREKAAADHAFLQYTSRQERKHRDAKELLKKRHVLVVEGERERALVGDKILDEEDKRLLYVASLVTEKVMPFHSPADIVRAKKKDKKKEKG